MSILRWLIAVCIPIILVMFNVRLVMTPLFLSIEYNRPGFPEDPYGFTRADRLRLAPLALDYLIFNQDISALGNLRSDGDVPLFNSRELHHMRDVQVLTNAAYGVAWGAAGMLVLGSGYGLWRSRAAGAALMERIGPAFHLGGWLTLTLMGCVVAFALVGWQMFFTGFHTLFFADGTWYFLTSDTLIRLFPEQFWFDAALTVGGLTALEAVLIVWWARRSK